jgi:hypothetical protein
MAGRPRTMAKRVQRILEQHQMLAHELGELMPKQYRPATGEPWSFESDDGDPLPGTWRKAVFEIEYCGEYLHDLLCFLELKAEKASRSGSLDGTEDATDDEEDGAGEQDRPNKQDALR